MIWNRDDIGHTWNLDGMGDRTYNTIWPSIPKLPQIEYYAGIDLGQASDFTAFCVIEQHRAEPKSDQTAADAKARDLFNVRHLERFPIGTRYTQIVEIIGGVVKQPPFTPDSYLVIDATGVGAPILDMFKQAGLPCKLVAITITGGNEVHSVSDGYNVPKRDLISATQVLLQSERLKIAPELKGPQFRQIGDIAINELLNFKMKISVSTGHDSYEAWREGIHDDLVLAISLPCWYATRYRRVLMMA